MDLPRYHGLGGWGVRYECGLLQLEAVRHHHLMVKRGEARKLRGKDPDRLCFAAVMAFADNICLRPMTIFPHCRFSLNMT